MFSKKVFISFIIMLSFTILSCFQKEERIEDTSNWDIVSNWIETEERVPHYNTLYFTNGQGYEFKNASSSKLIIPLAGHSWSGGRVGEIGEKLTWNPSSNWLLPFYNEYTIFIPERFDWGRGTRPFWDIENREKYTFDNVIACYASVIREYLSQNEYDTIIIFGHSEGGAIAPELYFHLEDFNISAIVSSGAGGLTSATDITTVRRGVPLDDESLRLSLALYNNYLETYRGRYEEAPDEIRFKQTGEEFIPTIYSLSQQARRPFNFYKKIDIPVLFIHGDLDTFVSKIATKYVEENLPDKPFDYIYYPGTQHYPTTVRELMRMRADIAEWLKEKGL